MRCAFRDCQEQATVVVGEYAFCAQHAEPFQDFERYPNRVPDAFDPIAAASAGVPPDIIESILDSAFHPE